MAQKRIAVLDASADRESAGFCEVYGKVCSGCQCMFLVGKKMVCIVVWNYEHPFKFMSSLCQREKRGTRPGPWSIPLHVTIVAKHFTCTMMVVQCAKL